MDSSYENLLTDIKFLWFRGGPNFAIVLSNDVIMTSIVTTGLSNRHIL